MAPPRIGPAVAPAALGEVAAPSALRHSRRRRAADLGISTAALAALAPLFVILAVLIKATSPGPVLYRQVRVGQERRGRSRRRGPALSNRAERRYDERRRRTSYGRPFEIVKFRTMRPDAEATGPQWSAPGDPRVTTIGRLLRLTRLDETPQFLNVIRGDMSLVGPRPERPCFVDEFVVRIPRYRHRLRVKPGLTGQAQVSLAYDATLDDVRRKLDEDLDWIDRKSLRHDLSILARTIAVVLTGRGAR